MKRFLGVLLALAPATAHADKTFNSGTGGTVDCAKDPNVTINTSNGTYTLKGACKDVTVNGGSTKVTIESTEELTVNGSKNTVTVTAAGEIQVNGSSNKVTWKKGTSGAAPEVANAGTQNTITNDTSGSSSSGATTTTGSGATDAPAATALDCTKTKSVSITKGNGNYKITGTCDKVAISGGSNTVAIQAAKNLSVTGSKNTVMIDKADKIAATGSNNTITWGAGLSVATPKTATIGKGNTISSATVPDDKLPQVPKNKTGAIANPPGTMISCAKGGTHSIDTNDGNYTFSGTCDAIAVAGNNNNLKIEGVKALSIAGNGNSIDVTSIDKLGVSGNNNSARWKKGVSGARAKVTNPGNNNTILQTK